MSNDERTESGHGSGGERVTRLEETACHLERLCQDLHEVMLGQASEMRELRSGLKRVEQRISLLEEGASDGRDAGGFSQEDDSE